jgi:hypothetical protein
MVAAGNGLRKKIAEETIKIISEVIIMRYTCTAVARCFLNILEKHGEGKYEFV